MPVDLWYRIGVGNTNMVWLNAHQLSVLGVRSVDCEEALPLTALSDQP